MRTLLTVAWLALLTACAGLAGLSQKPEVSVASVDLRQLGFLEQHFAVQLRIRNPNDVALPITGLSFDIEVNGQRFVSGVSDKAVTVPRFGDALLEVTAISTLAGALKQFYALQRGAQRGVQNGSQLRGPERLDYRISGRLQLAGVGSVPFERQGDLRLPMFDRPPDKAPLAPGAEPG